MFIELQSSAKFHERIQTETALLVYFSNDGCSVCKSLRPKIELMVQKEFPLMNMVYIKTDVLPETAGQLRVFTIPTVLVFFDGRETIRKIRNFSVEELMSDIRRPYSLIFSE